MPYIPTDTDCSELNLGMCGGKMTPTMLDNCDSMYFDGVDNVTINQGAGIDLADGVTAYDSTGAEIPFEYEPTEIDKCSVGEHEVIYKAIGADERLLPSMCGENFLSMACSGIGTLIAKRLVTIEQADPPTINGIGAVTLSVDEPFDPMNGVTGVDDNGNPVDVTYSGKLADSAEGDIASFETDLTDPLKSLQVFLDPIQDLHGYDAPWVGGAGKNKCDPSRFNRTNNGITFAPTSAQKISITGTATGNAYSGSNATDYASTWVKLKAGTYTVSTNGIASTQRLCIGGYDVNNNPITTYNTAFGDITKTFTVSVDFGIWYWLFVPNGETVNETVSIQIEQGSTATDWTPYENLCPISGHDEVGVSVVGKNLWSFDSSYTSESAGSFIPVSDSRAYYLKAGTYTLSFYANIPTMDTIQLRFWDKNQNPTVVTVYFANTGTGTKSQTFTLTEDAYYVRNAYANTAIDISNFQIELGSTATEYEPYNGQSYNTQLGQTVYGGTLDVVSGVLTVDRATVNLGTMSWNYYSAGSTSDKAIFYSPLAGAVGKPNSNVANCMAEKYKTDSVNGVLSNVGGIGISNNSNPPNVWVSTSSQSDTPSGQLCYELATPQTYQLTPQQVQTLIGQDNVWSEDGEVSVVFAKSIPESGEYSYPLDGVYEIEYTAVDECGNEASVTREIRVA